jgi:hypothetical protein
MATELNRPAGEIGLTVLQAATPESIEAVTTRWLDTHPTTEVISIDLQTTGVNGPLYLCITYKRERGAHPGR